MTREEAATKFHAAFFAALPEGSMPASHNWSAATVAGLAALGMLKLDDPVRADAIECIMDLGVGELAAINTIEQLLRYGFKITK